MMKMVDGFSLDNLPDVAHARQLKTGFSGLTFEPGLEREFARSRLEETLGQIRVNLVLAIIGVISLSTMEAQMLGRSLHRILSMVHMLVIVPLLLIMLAASFAARRHRVYRMASVVTLALCGLGQVAVHVTGALAGVEFLFSFVILTTVFSYLMAGLTFYRALTVNVLVLFAFLAAGIALPLPEPNFTYDAFALVAANLVGASILYMHEKTSRGRFLEAGLLREMVARDGLTGIQNRRMFDQHMQRIWQQAVREEERIAVLLADIDCFKNYNDRYGHQAGDECLRAVASSLSQCARRPLDFVARYGGEEFVIVLYEANREYVAEVLTRIQRSIAELNIPHEASTVASRLTLSIGAAYATPTANRTPEGLIQLADEALYSAKEQGRNRVIVMEAEYQNLRTGRFEKRRAQRAV